MPETISADDALHQLLGNVCHGCKGGFHNPLIAWEVQSLAERVLAAPTLREAAHV